MPAADKPVPTSLKLPAQVKAQIDAAARADGLTPHAYMVRVLQQEAERRQQRAQFQQDALAALEEAQRIGAHDLDDVKAYFAARKAGQNPPPPPLKPLHRA